MNNYALVYTPSSMKPARFHAGWSIYPFQLILWEKSI